MNILDGVTLPESLAVGARAPTEAELSAMMSIVDRFDHVQVAGDLDALGALFSSDAVCEIKPAGIRFDAPAPRAEYFRRTVPGLAASFAARELQRTWKNQNGVLREWLYPVTLASGRTVGTRQLEIIEFADGLGKIASYRLRMNLLYAKLFERALGEDFFSFPGVKQVPR